MRVHKLAAAASVLLMSAGAAYASTYTIDTRVTLLPRVPELYARRHQRSRHSRALITRHRSIRLLGQIALPSGVKNFFTADPAGSAGNSSGLVKGTIQVDFTFTEKNSMGVTIGTGSLLQDGTFQANYNSSGPNSGLACSSSTGQSDCLYWNPLGATLNSNPALMVVRTALTANQNNQSTTASVTDLVTLSDGASFDVNFFDAQDWDITPGVSFTNVDPNPTPLPAALPLFAGGLGFVGLLVRRRKKQQASI